ncbi:hypothetical protein T265_01447 [Opisthorchis viverrini]|uniref:Cadherin domain-containing protein n=1 Tax=Opisthorchis viverrini TaxID=6198 RepID=A0A075A2U7_OPIVI|nr:hypothetical protein T265_01447 [Opisthorchis viverrini]KER32577.1 hypothetical protein T265_01447 [Opisthorchis viverrini]
MHLVFNRSLLVAISLWFSLNMHVSELAGSNIQEGLRLYMTEEARPGTVIASGAQLGLAFLSSDAHVPRIINQKDPGVSSLSFRFGNTNDQSGSRMHNLQLVVEDRVDRESICPSSSTGTAVNSAPGDGHVSSDFHIDTVGYSLQNPLQIANLGSEDSRSPSRLNDDCTIPLRVATNVDGVQAIHQIFVNVQDINDNPPTWSERSISILFRDGDPAGTKQPLPLATDPDFGLNAVVTYRLRDAAENNHLPQGYPTQNGFTRLRGTEVFELHKESSGTGFIRNRLFLVTKQETDREARPQGWNLILIAANIEGSPILSSQLMIHVNITDINDNGPQFSQSVYQPVLNNQKVGVIPETVGVGQILLRVYATDADEGVNAAIKYNFAPGPQLPLIKHFFELTQDGELRVRQKLDVDKPNAGGDSTHGFYLPTTPMVFEIQAVDGADPAYARTGYATVKLTVEDVDDEPPSIRVHPVRPWNGQLRTNDGSHTEAELSVVENEPAGQLIALVEVSDPDSQGREIIRCSLIGKSQSLFRLAQQDVVGNEYQVHTTSKLDREQTSRLLLTIECRDLVEHVASTTVGINVLDVNDNAPKFQETLYQFSLLEDDGEQTLQEYTSRNRSWLSATGRVFVRATDEDEGPNSRINYALKHSDDNSPDNRFSIDAETGQLFALGPFDREQERKHRLVVVATDNGEPKLTGLCTVEVIVMDVNDNAPFFPQQRTSTGGYSFSVLENQLPGTRIGQVEAFDADQISSTLLASEMLDATNGGSGLSIKVKDQTNSEKLTFGLKNETDAQAFWIDPKSGVLITRAILDREKQAAYTFHVTVRDGPANNNNSVQRPILQLGGHLLPSATRVHEVMILVTVTVEDENDNDPIFKKPNSTNHMVLLDPSAIPGQSLLQLQAVDPDEGINGLVTYAIRGGNAGNLFNVDPRTGLLYLENQLPRRAVAEATAASSASASQKLREQSASESDPSAQSRNSHVPTHPTYLLALEACDQGEPRRCSHFPNLQIQLRVPNDLGMSQTDGQLLLSHAAASNQLLMGHSSADSDSFLNARFEREKRMGSLSTAEIVIITLSAFFSMLIIAVVVTICIIRHRTHRVMTNQKVKDPRTLKISDPNTGNTVEMVDQGKLPCSISTKCSPLCANKQFINRGLNGGISLINNSAIHEFGTIPGTGFHVPCPGTSPSTGLTGPLNVFVTNGSQQPTRSISGLVGRGSEFDLLSGGLPAATLPHDYQALQGWTDVDENRYCLSPLEVYPNRGMEPSRYYYTQRAELRRPDKTEWERYDGSALESEKPQMDEASVELLDSRETSQPSADSALKISPSSGAKTFSPRTQKRASKPHMNLYGGFPKSTFV